MKITKQEIHDAASNGFVGWSFEHLSILGNISPKHKNWISRVIELDYTEDQVLRFKNFNKDKKKNQTFLEF